EIRRKKRFASSSSVGPRDSQLALPASVTNGAGQQKDGMGKTTLYRRLMVAVTPWAGNMVQEWAFRMKEVASRKSKAASYRRGRLHEGDSEKEIPAGGAVEGHRCACGQQQA
ncbi:hypothetical protein L345_07968, partial [Ophiophagus hannah]